MTRALRALCVLAALGAGALTLVVARPASGQTPAAAAPSCNDRLEVLLMMDTSASLKTTDPQNRRVEAAEVLVRSLADSASASGGTVDLAVTGFGSAVTEVGTASLPTATASAVDMVRSFTNRTDDRNTDYVLALRYAADHFRALTDVPAACKRLVWFTDGAYSIDDLAAPGIATYTSSTSKAAIEGELEGQVCGPLPGPSRLNAPLSDQIRAAGFVVQLVDFRVPGAETPVDRAERAATAPVIARLLSGDGTDPCRVPGGRVEAAQASELAAEFFTQGQIALGRREVPCPVLAAGLPAAETRSVTARADDPGRTVTISAGGAAVASGTGFATWSAPSGSTPAGRVTATTAGGSLAGCYADLAATIATAGDAGVYAGATSSLVDLTVAGAAGTPTALGPDAVTVAATVDGAPVTVAWVPASATWRVTVPGPRTAPPRLQVQATTPGWGEVATFDQQLPLTQAPPLPRVAWAGPSTLQGAGHFTGRLTVTPAARTGGTLCVALGPSTASAPGVRLDVAAAPTCGPDTGPLAVDATIVVDTTTNADVTLTAPFTATYAPPGVPTAQPLDGTGQVAFPHFALTRPPDRAKEAAVTAALVLLSALVPLGLLLAIVNRQRRLPRPAGRYVATVALQATDGTLRRAPGPALTGDDLRPLRGDRSSYELPAGFHLARRRTWNPFAAACVEARSDHGGVTAVPWMAETTDRVVEVPAAFTTLVLLRADPGTTSGEAVLVTAPGAGPAEAEVALSRALATANGVSARVGEALGSLGSLADPPAPSR